MDHNDNEPKIDYYRPGTLINQRVAVKTCLSQYYGFTLDGEIIGLAAHELAKLLHVDPTPIVETMTYYSGKSVDEVVDRLAWLLPGNRAAFARGESVEVLEHQVVPEWCLTNIVGVCMNVPYRDVNGFAVGSILQTGPYAGELISRTYEDGDWSYMLYRFAGLPRAVAEMSEAWDLVGMYFYLRLRPATEFNKTLSYDRGYVTTSMAKMNRQHYSERKEDSSCPWVFKPRTYETCGVCPVGLDRCKYATHRRTREEVKPTLVGGCS